MTQYLLAPHAYVREVGRHAVFLDLKRDKYTAIDAEDVRDLRSNVLGWPHAEAESACAPRSARSDESRSILELLSQEGLLTTDIRFGKDASPVAVETVTETIDHVAAGRLYITRRDLWSFVHAWARISVMFRTLPLWWVVNRMRKRKASRRGSLHVFDAKEAHRLMTAYWILRPNFFDPKNACLRDSLTFIEFFSFYDMYPTLVFGVKMDPFAAHAWVQEGPMVLNDYIPHVRQFAPILAA